MPNTKIQIVDQTDENRGFTLVELLVVMSIIALLLTVGLSFYGNAQRASRDAKRRGDLDAIRKSVEVYRAERGTYTPATTFPCNQGWTADFSDSGSGAQGTGVGCGASFRNAMGTYFVNGVIPEDPFCSTTDNTCQNSWTNYGYQNSAAGSGNDFILYARLENAPTTPCVGAGWAATYNYCVRNQN